MKPFICLITGPAGVGKSTIADVLCRQFPKTARISVDGIRHLIKNGKVRAFPDTIQSKKQAILAIKNSCDLAKNLNDYKFSVFIDDIVETKNKLQHYIKETKGHTFFIFLLMCNQDTLKYRDNLRTKEHQMGQRSIVLHQKFKNRLNEKKWVLINTGKQSENKTVATIMSFLKPK